MFKRRRHKIKNIITVFISTLLVVCLIELIARFIYKNETKKQEVGVGVLEYLLDDPPAFSNKNIYTPDVLKTALTFTPLEYDNNSRIWRLIDFKSKNFNIINGFRTTEYSNKDAKNLIHMFGASTLYCQMVPDKHTVSSYLQLFVNNKSKNYNVLNYGVPSYMTKDQVIRLKESFLNSGDIVIFYGGSNDIAYIVDRDKRTGPAGRWDGEAHAPEHNIQYYNTVQKAIIKTYYRFPKRYILKTLYRNITQPNTTGIGVHKGSTEPNVQYLAKHYLNQIEIAKKVVSQEKGYFYNFLQPNLYSKNINTLTNEEKRIKKNDRLVRNSSETPFQISYPVLKKIIKNELNEYSYDLTSNFDNIKKEIFTGDYIHVNHIGNEAIARSIFNEIKAKIN